MSKVLTKINNAHNGSGIWSIDWVNDFILTGSMATTTAAATTTPSLKLWNLTGNPLSAGGIKPQLLAPLPSAAHHQLGITAALLSRTDPLALTASLDGSLRSWDLTVPRTPTVRASVSAGPAGALCIAQGGTGRAVAAGGCGGKVSLWAAGDGAAMGAYDVAAGAKYVTALGWEKGSDVIACGTSEGKIHLFSSENGSLISGGSGFSSHSRMVRKVCFGQKNLLFSAGDDGLVNVHDVRMTSSGSNGVVASYSGHKGKVLTVTSSPDGMLCATGGSDAVVKVWDARASWKERDAFYEHKDSVWGLAFSGDKTMLASVSDDGAMIFYSTI